ncbi:MAG: acetate--CoA ligase [Candidatus Dadabacteria bacterium]|nr:MAG: acetate--CoA ligase [Candidatus Dadabacteria bacterium]
MTESNNIESILSSDVTIEPPEAFRAKARTSLESYQEKYQRSLDDPQGFWGDIARELHWFTPFEQVVQWDPPFARWFDGGTTNICYNAVDRHAEGARANKAAIIWEGEPGDTRTLTWRELHREVQRFANVLRRYGVEKGDRIAIYMPMVPEAAIAMLACARLGAIHSVVFGGFSANALRDRILDAGAKVVLTADGAWRRGSVLPLKEAVDAAVTECPCVEHVVVLRRTGNDVNMTEGRDVWWHEAEQQVELTCPAEPVEAEHPLFILYTSGTTGKPKGVLHTTGGYMVGTYLTSREVFDLRDDDLYWCTADVGWVTGHSYIVYGPLLNGATIFMYEGAPNWPEVDRFWDMIERWKISILYTAPTAVRAFMKWGDQWPAKHDLSSLRLLGSVGEPINPEAWLWYYRVIGGERCPIVDTWWQTETGAIMLTTLPGAHHMRPGYAGLPFYGVDAAVVDEQGNPVPDGTGGLLVIRRPWPSMLRTVYGDDQRYKDTYWSKIEGCYFAGDGAVRNAADGYFEVLGRIDDVLNVSGHRLGTMEIESALVSHPAVAEAAVVGRPDDLKGEAVVAFVILEGGRTGDADLAAELKAHVANEIGAIAKPEEIRFTGALPKTRSGKIMRRLLRKIAAGDEDFGDTTTLEDPSIIAQLTAKGF